MFDKSIRKVKVWYNKYQDYIYIPDRSDIKDLMLSMARSLKRSVRDSRKRIPVFSLALLALLFGIEIVTSVYTHVASAQPSQTQQQASANVSNATISPSLTRIRRAPTVDPATACPEVPYGETLKLEDILENIIYAADPNNPNLTTALTPSQESPVQLSPTVASGGSTNQYTGISNSDAAVAQANALQDCENVFNKGVARPADGRTVTIEVGTYVIEGPYGQWTPCYGIMDVVFQADSPKPYCISLTSSSNGFFPCSDKTDGTADYNIIDTDWLSGDYWNQQQGVTGQSSGYFEQTPLTEPMLFPAMQSIGLLIMGPTIVLIGVQMASGMSGFRMANAMEGLSRMVLSVVLIAACYAAISVLITFSNSLSQAIVQMHGTLPYASVVSLNNADTSNPTATTAFGFYLPGDEQSSYREIIMPVSRWGCAGNEFVDILGEKLASDLLGFIPFIGGILKLSLEIADAVQVIKYAGEFILAILSIMLAVQIVARLVFLNFYILMAPVAFGCWGLPGGVGQSVVRSWFKGFFSVLSIQVIQLFVITVGPLLLPGVSGSGTYLPSIASSLDKINLFAAFVNELPSIAILWIVLRVPRMMGTSAGSAIASAGQIAGGAVVAVGAAAYQIV